MSEEVEEFDMSLLDPKAEQPSEPEPVEDEVVDQVDEEPKELPAGKEPQSDPKPSTADLMDKEMQRLQQLRATYQREIEKLTEAPTERQVERVEKAKTKLDKYLETQDVDPYQGVTDIAEEVMADRGRSSSCSNSLRLNAENRRSEKSAIRRNWLRCDSRWTSLS